MYFHKDADDYPSPPSVDSEDANTTTLIPTLSKLTKSFTNKEKDRENGIFLSNTSINTPRGVIDIIKRNAIFSVSSINHAPTPFCLSVAMKSELNWILCFDEEKELIKWMCALTDVNVRRSVLMQKARGYQHCRPGLSQDKWVPPKASLDKGDLPASVSDTTKENHDTEVVPMVHEHITDDDDAKASIDKGDLPASASDTTKEDHDTEVASMEHEHITDDDDDDDDDDDELYQNTPLLNNRMQDTYVSVDRGLDKYRSAKLAPMEHTIDIDEELRGNTPLLINSIQDRRLPVDKYRSVEKINPCTSNTSITITHNDLIILVALVNISLGYICYLAINGEIIGISYLYVTLVVNSGSFFILNRNKNHDSDVGATMDPRQQFRTERSNTLTGRSVSQWKSEAKTSSVHDSLVLHSNRKSAANDNKGKILPFRSQENTIAHTRDIPTNHESIINSLKQPIETIPHASHMSISPKLNRFKPKAGASMIRLKETNGSKLNKDNIPMVGWFPTPALASETRGANYLSSRKKIRCPASLYELVKADIFESNDQMLEIGQQFDLSEIKLDYGKGETIKKTWNAPDIFVISLTLPTTVPKLGRSNNEKKGYVLTGYYRMRKETRKILSVVTLPYYDPLIDDQQLCGSLQDDNQRQMINGVKLWEDWCRCAPSDPVMQKRFKFIAKGDNLREVGCPGWICNYNGKPILIKKPGVTGFLFSYDNMMEFDLSLLPFPYLFKSAMSYLKENLFSKMLMTFSFVIEGRAEDELPELLIGNGLQLCYLNPEHVYTAESVLEGTSPTSF